MLQFLVLLRWIFLSTFMPANTPMPVCLRTRVIMSLIELNSYRCESLNWIATVWKSQLSLISLALNCLLTSRAHRKVIAPTHSLSVSSALQTKYRTSAFKSAVRLFSLVWIYLDYCHIPAMITIPSLHLHLHKKTTSLISKVSKNERKNRKKEQIENHDLRPKKSLQFNL